VKVSACVCVCVCLFVWPFVWQPKSKHACHALHAKFETKGTGRCGCRVWLPFVGAVRFVCSTSLFIRKKSHSLFASKLVSCFCQQSGWVEPCEK
jgi:hypothetical protein